jgi:uncharacterized protein YPO0396
VQIPLFDFTKDDTEAGFRLHHMEIYNWGTFHRHIWRFSPEGFNSLLTGDIGSGKSTLVDALTSLLVPHHRIVYNKAAGATSKERSLYSYVRGEYKSEKDDLGQAAKAVALRDESSYTVLLAHFYNKGFKQAVTLAQVFWLKDQQRNPERFFVVSLTPLTVGAHFSKFGSSIGDLKKRLQRMKNVEVMDRFKDYSNRFRNLFGIQNEQALDLFYQAVSMKSVGNLTDFVRQHMLDKSNVEERLDELRRASDNLTRAHESVLKVKRQIQLLEPLTSDGRRYRELSDSLGELRRCREALQPYFALHKILLLESRIEQLNLEIQKSVHHLEVLNRELTDRRHQEVEMRQSIDASGGRRLNDIQREMERLGTERDRKRSLEQAYRSHAERLSLVRVRHSDDFFRNQSIARHLLAETEQSIEAVHKQEIDVGVQIRERKSQGEQLQEELQSLRSRKTNIPLQVMKVRREMAEVLRLSEEELPFAGELLQVDRSAAEWEGALERVLHNFGLSLLVPEHHYAQVSYYVDRTQLKGRLVYYRVREMSEVRREQGPAPGALVHKLRIKPNSPFYDWLENELIRRFDIICCDSIEEFRRLPNALTRSGQIKSGGQRHEKDDRHKLDDRRRFVLGWSNKEKIRTLEAILGELEAEILEMITRLTRLQQEQRLLSERRDCCRDILQIKDYGEIDWQPITSSIQTLEEEKLEIEQGSDLLRSLRSRLEQVQREIREKETRKDAHLGSQSRCEQQLEDRLAELKTAQEEKATLSEPERKQLFPTLDQFSRETLGDKLLTLQNLEKSQSEVRLHIQQKIDSDAAKSQRLSQKIIQQMQHYRMDYPAETGEVDASLEAMAEYDKMLTALMTEDLPRHEARFKKLLNEGTINSVALFQNQLDKERQSIEDKIRTINVSLREIEYNSGTFIELVTDRSQDVEIRDFQQDLRQCLAHALDVSDLYSENKFLQVKKLIDRFNGREGLVDVDQRWRVKVTDVRNWFTFSASERWHEDGSEKEFYSDSSGKSGGQKEKLAYTILASALAYQFGLEWGAKRSRSFRFVVIDEAFGRGSDESTRYGLELFKKLNLQLLIVTPLQKIHIIEDYIHSVHFVHNQEGNNSVLRNLTLEEYRDEKKKHLAGTGA